MAAKSVFCCSCDKVVRANREFGSAIYGVCGRSYSDKIFFQCPTCRNYVGTHNDTGQPLGVIPTKAVRILRQKIHDKMDSAWKSGRMTRSEVYSFMSNGMGYRFHCADLKDESEGLRALELAGRL